MSDVLHIVCPHCDAINRIPTARLADHPKCGQCHKDSFIGHPIELTSATFQRQISRSDIPIVVDFWAPWCGPCKMMAPQFAGAAKQLEPGVRLAKVNTEIEQELAAKYGIRSIPTLMLFKGGREVSRQPGAMGTADIVRWVQSRAASAG
jgi:thioredoxin 2